MEGYLPKKAGRQFLGSWEILSHSILRGKNGSVRSDHQTGRFPINTVKSCKIKITHHGLMAYNYRAAGDAEVEAGGRPEHQNGRITSLL
jgi:hypothetical protein